MDKAKKLLRMLVCFPIYIYKYLVSPFLGSHCRFFPSCSQYAIDAIQLRGVLKGLLLTCRRLCRCHPGCEGGYDPVKTTEEC